MNNYINFKTGEKKEIKKNKEGETIKGQIKIEVFNKNKEKIKEINSSNLISVNAIKTMLYETNKGINSVDSKTFSCSSFGHLLLLNTTLKENKTDTKIDVTRDNVVGFANVSFPCRNSNTIQGTIEPAGCSYSVEEGVIKLYFTFSFDKCNGKKFNTIAFGAENADMSKKEPFFLVNKPIEKIYVQDTIKNNFKFLFFDNLGNPYIFYNNYFYNVQVINNYKIKQLKLGTKITKNTASLGTKRCILKPTDTDNFYICSSAGNGNFYLYEYDKNFIFLKKWSYTGGDNWIDWDSDGKRIEIFSNKIFCFRNENDTEIYIKIFKFDNNNKITFEEEKKLDLVGYLDCVYSDSSYIYVNTNNGDWWSGNPVISSTLLKINNNNIDEVITNSIKDRYKNCVYTYVYPLKNSFITSLTDTDNTYISTSIRDYGSISNLTTEIIKKDTFELKITYKFCVNMQSTGN